jgi:hypothetical protein
MSRSLELRRHTDNDGDVLTPAGVEAAVRIGAGLAGGYALGVLGLGQLLGRDSGLAVAGTTLALAAAFQPLRRRLQDAIDRRFNRRRYDAARTIGAFAARLRHHTDLDALRAEVLAVVDQTMQPTAASLWLVAGEAQAGGTAGASSARASSA